MCCSSVSMLWIVVKMTLKMINAHVQNCTILHRTLRPSRDDVSHDFFDPPYRVYQIQKVQLHLYSWAALFDVGLSRISPTSTMLQPRLPRAHAGLESPLTALASSLNALSLCSRHSYLQPLATSTFVRHASHATQGRANGPGDSAGRRLGAKKTASEYVVPGNIIFKQRGKAFNCAIFFLFVFPGIFFPRNTPSFQSKSD